ncbi:MAG: hypothetical protein M3179_03110, partial [Actinomycetota bacterium]|nr:hypothetical protein [Actinomycetota bacterium]
PPPPGKPTAAAALKKLGRRVGKKAVSALIEGAGSVVAPDGGLTVDRLRRMFQAADRLASSAETRRPAR